MSRDIQNEEREIRNGNRYTTETHGTGMFPRDVDRLFHKYSNLRYKVYNTHKDSFNQESARQDLKSYIDEQFIKLTKEYDVNGEVDFPGYIKKALNLRVRHSYVKGQFRDGARERLGAVSDEVENLLGTDNQSQADIEDAELIDALLTQANFTNVEIEVFTRLVRGTQKDMDIVEEVSQELNVSKKAVKDAIRNVKDYVLINLRN